MIEIGMNRVSYLLGQASEMIRQSQAEVDALRNEVKELESALTHAIQFVHRLDEQLERKISRPKKFTGTLIKGQAS